MNQQRIQAALERAQRSLDGMSYNRDAMARDVQDLVALVVRLEHTINKMAADPTKDIGDIFVFLEKILKKD